MHVVQVAIESAVLRHYTVNLLLCSINELNVHLIMVDLEGSFFFKLLSISARDESMPDCKFFAANVSVVQVRKHL